MISVIKANSFAFLGEANVSVKVFVRNQNSDEEIK